MCREPLCLFSLLWATLPGACSHHPGLLRRYVSSTSGAPTQMVPDTGIQGLVTSRDTGAPVEALAVLAYNFESGAFITRAFTTATGRYFLEVPPGLYSNSG